MSPTLIADVADLRPSDPLFLMLRPERAAARQISRVAWHIHDKYQLTQEPLAEDRFHVSLLGFGACGALSPRDLAAIDDVASALTMPRFLAGFDWLMKFGKHSNQPLALCGSEIGVGGIIMLRDELGTSLARRGFPLKRRDCTPHISLLYGDAHVEEQPIEEIRWTVSEVLLVCSQVGRRRHVVLEQWALRAPPRA